MVTYEVKDSILNINLLDRLDTNNAEESEKTINMARSANPGLHMVLNLDALDYLSSAGLRIILKLRKADDELKIINVQPDVYDVFEMTGFTAMIPVEKKEK